MDTVTLRSVSSVLVPEVIGPALKPALSTTDTTRGTPAALVAVQRLSPSAAPMASAPLPSIVTDPP